MKQKLKPGRLFFVYMIGYAVGRLWIEALRIDPATEIAGIRINIWTMSTVLLVGVVGVWLGRLGPGERDTYRREHHQAGVDPDSSDQDSSDQDSSDQDSSDQDSADAEVASGD